MTTPEEKKLPTLEELYNEETISESMKQNALNILLNQPPNPRWLKQNKQLTRKVVTPDGEKLVPITYIPIERVEYLLTRLFLRWWVEIKSVQKIENSIVCVLTLFYQNPINNMIEQQDGVGACPIQTRSGAGANDMANINSQAIQLAAPAAESYAVKDAAEKIGKIFGKDMNRADEVAYDMLVNTFGEQKREALMEKLNEALNLCQDQGLVEAVRKDLAEKLSTGTLTNDEIKKNIKKFEK